MLARSVEREQEEPRGESTSVPLGRGDPKLADYSRAKFPACPKKKCFRPERKLTRDFTLTFDRSSSSEKSRVSEFICRGPGCMLVPCKLEF